MYSKQNCILYIEISIPFVIWQIVYMAIVGAKVGVFLVESESAVRIAPSRLGEEL